MRLIPYHDHDDVDFAQIFGETGSGSCNGKTLSGLDLQASSGLQEPPKWWSLSV